MSNSNFKTCPGINKFVRPTPSYFPCPNCGGNVEIWSDEDLGSARTVTKNLGDLKRSSLAWIGVNTLINVKKSLQALNTE